MKCRNMSFLMKEHSEIACWSADDSTENWCALNQGVFGLSGSGRKVYFLCFADLYNSPQEKQQQQQISYWKPLLTALVE